jgi:hypothetical protein
MGKDAVSISLLLVVQFLCAGSSEKNSGVRQLITAAHADVFLT